MKISQLSALKTSGSPKKCKNKNKMYKRTLKLNLN